MTLLMFVRIRNHNRSLSSPEQTSAETEEDTSKEIEARDISMYGCKKTGSINAVSNTSESECVLDTELVDKGTTEETKDGKCTVQGGVLLIHARLGEMMRIARWLFWISLPCYQPEWRRFYHLLPCHQER